MCDVGWRRPPVPVVFSSETTGCIASRVHAASLYVHVSMDEIACADDAAAASSKLSAGAGVFQSTSW